MKKHLKILLLTGVFCLLTALLALSASAAYETGGKSYDTLKEAVTAVKSGGTIVATVLGVLFVPVFFYYIMRLVDKVKGEPVKK